MSGRRVVIVGNSSSGRGRALDLLSRIGELLEADGHQVLRARAGPGEPRGGDAQVHPLNGQLRGADALILAGGDGTVHHALEQAVAAEVPVYHLPSGNENLFAREFGMDSTWDRLRAALTSGKVVRSDLGACNGKLFALMVSVGFDASVVGRVSRARRAKGGVVSHADYVAQGLRELLSATFARIEVEVDGKRVVDGQTGVLIVANSRQYGGGLDPARDAKMDDGMLNVVFLPASSRLALLSWAWRLGWTRGLSRVPKNERARRPLDYVGALCASGSSVRVRAVDGATCAQIDGEYLGRLGSPELPSLELSVRPGVLPVLTAR